jgi:hypothetical protein
MCCNVAGGTCESQDDCCTGRYCAAFAGCLDVNDFGCGAGDQCLSGICTSGDCACVLTGTTCGANGNLSCCSGYCNSSNTCAKNPNYDAGCNPETCPVGTVCSACQTLEGGGSYECAGSQTSTTGRCCIPGSSWELCGQTGDSTNNGCCLTANGSQLGCDSTKHVCCNGAGDQCATSADCCAGNHCDIGGTGKCVSP